MLFHQTNDVIKDNSFQLLLGFPELNLNLNFDLILMLHYVSNVLHFSQGLIKILHKIYKLQILHVKGLNVNYRLIAAFILKP